VPVDIGGVEQSQGHSGPHKAGRGTLYPGYVFELNKGYPCPRHKAALQYLGPTAIHRRSWVFMDHIPWTGCPRVRPPDPQQSLFDQV
jgi:hypothetical protein